jgi:hypothetical protein
MPYKKPIANLEIRESQERLASDDADSATAFDAAIHAAIAQTPEGTTRQVAFMLAWIDGGTFAGRIELEHYRYAGLRAHLVEVSAVRHEHTTREPVEVAQGLRARVWMADVHKLLEGTRARAQALRDRTAARSPLMSLRAPIRTWRRQTRCYAVRCHGSRCPKPSSNDRHGSGVAVKVTQSNANLAAPVCERASVVPPLDGRQAGRGAWASLRADAMQTHHHSEPLLPSVCRDERPRRKHPSCRAMQDIERSATDLPRVASRQSLRVLQHCVPNESGAM